MAEALFYGVLKHRRRKAAAKCHMRLDLQTFLPSFAIVKEASTHDSIEAPSLCKDIKAGEIVIFDKAYIDFRHLYALERRDIFWITRAKENLQFSVVRTLCDLYKARGSIIRGVLWEALSVSSILAYCGTALGPTQINFQRTFLNHVIVAPYLWGYGMAVRILFLFKFNLGQFF